MKNKPYFKIGVNSSTISFMHTVVVIAYYIIKLLIVERFLLTEMKVVFCRIKITKFLFKKKMIKKILFISVISINYYW